MTPQRAVVIVIALAAVVYALFAFDVVYPDRVDDFATCVAAGNPAMESYPRQCHDPKSGQTFTEDIVQPSVSDRIRVTAPAGGASVTSPIAVSGEAVGGWYFEASFPVQVLDANGKVIGEGPAQAQGEWMTPSFVPFSASIAFTKPTTATGIVRFKNDNPSGLPENDAHVDVPVKFSGANSPATTTGSVKPCVVSGCSAQLCGETEMMSTCEYREVYQCYRTAKCERQATGQCGWTQTPQLAQCVADNS